MADDQGVSADAGQIGNEGEQRIQLRDTSGSTEFSNFFTVTGGQDSLMVSFGTRFGNADTVAIENKIVLTPRTAKRLAMSLGQVVRNYEDQFGEIEMNQPSSSQGNE